MLKRTILCSDGSVNVMSFNHTLSNRHIGVIIANSMHLVAVSPFPPTITGIGQYGYHVIRALAEAKSFSRLTVLAGAKTAGASLLNSDSTEIDYCWAPDESKARQVILSRLKRLNPDLVWFNLGASVFGKSPLSNL